MRNTNSSLRTGPGFPGPRYLLAGLAAAALAGLVITAWQEGAVSHSGPVTTAPPATAAHVAAPTPVQQTLEKQVARQEALIRSLRTRLDATKQELNGVRTRLEEVAYILSLPPAVPWPKPQPGAPLPDRTMLTLLQQEESRLVAERDALRQRIAGAEAFVSEARILLSVSQAERS